MKSIFLPFYICLLIVLVFYGQVNLIINDQFFAVLPRTWSGLWGVLLSPLVHGDLQHLLGNLSVLFPLLILLRFVYKRSFILVLPTLWIMTGLMVWLLARPSYHIGASGVVYAIQSFLLVSGAVKKLPWMMAVGGVSIMLFGGGFFFGLLPVEPHVSWESHLLGALVGVVVAFMFKDIGPTQKHKKTRTLFRDEYELFDIKKKANRSI